VAPVFEGDMIETRVEVTGLRALKSGGGLADLRAVVTAEHGASGQAALKVPPGTKNAVLDWRFVALFA
jgi:acyl dehydratase